MAKVLLGIDALDTTTAAIRSGRFESLGDNCEFGFALLRLGGTRSSLFNWTYMSAQSLLALLSADFQDFYCLENLMPAHGNMAVETRYEIGWHTEMFSEQVAGGFRFIQTDAERVTTFQSELSKRLYLRDVFLAHLRRGGMIYVIKSNLGIPAAILDGIELELDRLAQGAAFTLLELRVATHAAQPGVVGREAARRLLGWVSRFAAYDTADDLAEDDYRRILPLALELAP
jgi:hypothetical protein